MLQGSQTKVVGDQKSHVHRGWDLEQLMRRLCLFSNNLFDVRLPVESHMGMEKSAL